MGKTKIGGSIKTENVPEKSLEENVSTDVPKINNKPEYKCEPQLQTCKKPECPVGGKPMGASYAAAELIKRNHRSKLKKRLFPDDKDGEEEVFESNAQHQCESNTRWHCQSHTRERKEKKKKF